MQEFIPLEDDWSLLEAIAEQRLVPYQAGMTCMRRARHGARSVALVAGLVAEPAEHHSHWPRDLG